MPPKLLNCWEVKQCGREPNGANVAEFGLCPASVDTAADGVNGGMNGGRLCWAIAGTFCGGTVQGTAAAKHRTCLNCDFFERVNREQSRAISAPTHVSRTSISRLARVVLALSVFWTLFLVLSLSIWWDALQTPVQVGLGVVTIASFALARFLRSPRMSPRKVLIATFGYEALLVLTLSMLEYGSFGSEAVSVQLSWTCVLLLFFPLIASARPRAVVIGSLVAAMMSPLAYAFCLTFGADLSNSLSVMVSRFWPQLVCAGLAVVPARLLQNLAGDVKRARRLGAYELVDQIGRGGMGEVWRARHRMLARPAAIKLIRPDGDIDRLRRRFEREAQATATLESPHTVELYDYGISQNGQYYFVMELLRGVNLETLVHRFGAQPPERVVYLLRQACDSLDEAHRMGLVHRDIKPSNLFAAIKGRKFDFVKVLDFGLVKLDLGNGSVKALLGTPGYMAPEAVYASASVDGRADIYALGCIAYYLLTGQPVFEGEGNELFDSHTRQQPVAPSKCTNATIPEPLEALVMMCLAKDPTERPDATVLASMLDDILFEDPWTCVRAEAWWSACLPDIVFAGQWSSHATEDSTAFLSTILEPVFDATQDFTRDRV